MLVPRGALILSQACTSVTLRRCAPPSSNGYCLGCMSGRQLLVFDLCFSLNGLKSSEHSIFSPRAMHHPSIHSSLAMANIRRFRGRRRRPPHLSGSFVTIFGETYSRSGRIGTAWTDCRSAVAMSLFLEGCANLVRNVMYRRGRVGA